MYAWKCLSLFINNLIFRLAGLRPTSLIRQQWRHSPSGNPEQPRLLFTVARFLQTLLDSKCNNYAS